jgi:hypothetical protein
MLALLFTAALAAASPLVPRQKTPLDYPPRVSGAAFTLIANVTSGAPNPLFNPNHWALTAERVGAGQNAVVLSSTRPGAVLFLNGTTRDISAENTSILSPPMNLTTGVVPLGLQFQFQTGGDRVVARLGINYGTGDIGAGIGIGLRDPYAKLFPPVGIQGGTFVVCKEANPTYGRPEYPVYWVRGAAEVDENCVRINLLAQCAPLPEIAGEQELNIVKAPVGCYEDVKGIDWSQW